MSTKKLAFIAVNDIRLSQQDCCKNILLLLRHSHCEFTVIREKFKKIWGTNGWVCMINFSNSST